MPVKWFKSVKQQGPEPQWRTLWDSESQVKEREQDSLAKVVNE